MLRNSNNKIIRETPARCEIYDRIKSRCGLFSASQVHEMLKRKYDLSTIYRTLNLFDKEGLVYSETIGKKKYYYVSSDPHHHILCTDCGATKCFPCNEEIKKPEGFSGVKHRLVMWGICSCCSSGRR